MMLAFFNSILVLYYFFLVRMVSSKLFTLNVSAMSAIAMAANQIYSEMSCKVGGTPWIAAILQRKIQTFAC